MKLVFQPVYLHYQNVAGYFFSLACIPHATRLSSIWEICFKILEHSDVTLLFISCPSKGRDSPAETSSANYAKQEVSQDHSTRRRLIFLGTRRESAVRSVGSRSSCAPNLRTGAPSVESFGHFGTNHLNCPMSRDQLFWPRFLRFSVSRLHYTVLSNSADSISHSIFCSQLKTTR